MVNKKVARLRRARRTRAKIAELRVARLSVFRSNSHIYAQLIAADGGRVVASASTLEPELRKAQPKGGTVAAAAAVGKRIAEKAKGAGIEQVAFDHSGFRYHGRIKALADAAREGGLKF